MKIKLKREKTKITFETRQEADIFFNIIFKVEGWPTNIPWPRLTDAERLMVVKISDAFPKEGVRQQPFNPPLADTLAKRMDRD